MRTIISTGFTLLAMLLGVSACGDDADSNDNGSDAARGPGDGQPLPEDGEVCTLVPGESTASDVKAVFGEPSSESRANGTLTLTYAIDDGSTWTFGFDADDLWNNISVSGGSTRFPSCWAPDGGWYERPDGGWWQRD